MKGLVRALIALVVLLSLGGCSIPHQVSKDYPQYLANNTGTDLGKTTVAHAYTVTPATQSHHYEFRSALAGYANVWIVDMGPILNQTMASPDVQHAFGNINLGTSDANGLLTFDVRDYNFGDYGAHLSMLVTYSNSGRELFKKTYDVGGESQQGKMFWGGEFAMKNAIQQSTKGAVDEVLRRVISDLSLVGSTAGSGAP